MNSSQNGYTLELRQRVHLMQNAYELVRVDSSGEQVLAHAKQKRFSLKEKVEFVSEDRNDTIFTIQARNMLELRGAYEVKDAGGQVLATLKKDFGRSLLRSTYNVESNNGRLVGTERTMWRSIGRRVIGVVTDLPWVLPIQFDFKNDSGQPLIQIDRKWKIRDHYVIQVNDANIDWRLAGAIAVVTDAFLNR